MNAETKIYNKMNQQLYKKVGKKYIPVNDPYAYDGLREGWWLIKVSPGCTSIRQQVFPSKAEIDAAIRDKEDVLIDIIRECCEAKPKEGVPLSEQALSDWRRFIAKHGEEFNMLHYPSLQECAEKIIKKIIEK